MELKLYRVEKTYIEENKTNTIVFNEFIVGSNCKHVVSHQKEIREYKPEEHLKLFFNETFYKFFPNGDTIRLIIQRNVYNRKENYQEVALMEYKKEMENIWHLTKCIVFKQGEILTDNGNLIKVKFPNDHYELSDKFLKNEPLDIFFDCKYTIKDEEV